MWRGGGADCMERRRCRLCGEEEVQIVWRGGADCVERRRCRLWSIVCLVEDDEVELPSH